MCMATAGRSESSSSSRRFAVMTCARRISTSLSSEAIWIRAKDDYTFNRSALYLNFVQEKALNRDISPPRGFKFTCTDSDRPCSESLEKLSKAFTVSDAEVSWDWEERKVVLAQTELPDVPRFILTINISEVGFVERVDLEIPFPRYPGQASLH